ncbi:MAG: hypothetical protein IJF76_01570 [Clostridia bacterium]|nr:hypothetical protein [Clostridia bacterium]
MTENKKFGLPRIISLVAVALLAVMLVLYFVPFYTFPVVKTTGEYDDANKTVYVTATIEDTTCSLAGFIWLPTSIARGQDLSSASLQVVYAVGEHDGYTIVLDDSDIAGKEYYPGPEEYIEAAAGEGSGNAKLGLNGMVLFSVFHMVFVLIATIICAFLTKTSHTCYFTAIIALWGIIAYLTQSALLIGAFPMLFLVLNALLLIASGINMYFSIMRMKKYMAERRIKLEKMGLR